MFSASNLDADIGPETAGATILKTPQQAAFGGFHGYFADPLGFRWEIATKPGWSVAPDGKVTIGPVDQDAYYRRGKFSK